MSFMDKLKFWKKDDPFSSDLNFAPPTTPTGGTDPYGAQPPVDSFAQGGIDYGMQQTGGFGQTNSQFGSQQNTGFDVSPVQGANNFIGGAQGGSVEKDLEIISAKLDALKSALESINQRLTNIERMAQTEQQGQHTKRTWY